MPVTPDIGTPGPFGAFRGMMLVAVTATALFGSHGASAWGAPSEATLIGGSVPDGPTLSIKVEAADTSAHVILLQYSDGIYVITDRAGIVATVRPQEPPPDESCSQVDATSVACPIRFFDLTRADRRPRMDIETGDGADRIDLRAVPVGFGIIYTGDGNDRVLTGTVRSLDEFSVRGGVGNDRLQGGTGYDHLYGGPGDDLIRTGAGPRFLPNRPSRFPSNVVEGGSGDDLILGGRAKDSLLGGSGRDHLAGRRGRDQIDAGPGNDTINSRDGRRDGISCGAGNPRRQQAIRDQRDQPVWLPQWLPDEYPSINC